MIIPIFAGHWQCGLTPSLTLKTQDDGNIRISSEVISYTPKKAFQSKDLANEDGLYVLKLKKPLISPRKNLLKLFPITTCLMTKPKMKKIL